MSQTFEVHEESVQAGAKIVAVGVGGGGGNTISHLKQSGGDGISLIMINTDAQVLSEVDNVAKIQIGEKITKGLGAGMKPEVGRDSALENYEDIKSALDGANIVFIAVGLGGGTGTGAAPIVAQIAKEVGALTISIVTKPFKHEGRKRMKLAEAGLEELRNESDSIVVVPNDKLASIIDKKLGFKDGFKMVDGILAQAVSGTAGIILSKGENDINLDFADLKTVMSHQGMALMGIGEGEGENAAYDAIKAAIEYPLLDNLSINGALGILIHLKFHPSFPMHEILEAMNIIHDTADEDADIIFGTSTSDKIPEQYIKVTIIATGFEKIETETIKEKGSKPESKIVSRPRLIIGGDIDDDDLESPTYIRNQQD